MATAVAACRGPLRICHLGKYYPPAPGGIESHVQTLAVAQALQGGGEVDVRVICVNHSDRRGRDVTWSRYGTTRTIQEADGDVRVTRLGRSATVARLDICPSLPWIIKALNHDPVDILHLHTPNPTMVLMVASLLRTQDTPLVITHHSDIVRQRVLRVLHDPFERMVYARAATILASSLDYVQGSPMLHLHREKVAVLPMGIDLTPHLQPSPGALAFEAKLRRQCERHGPIWLTVGRCVYYKGLPTAIEALQYVAGTLIVIGRGPLEGASRNAQQLQVQERIVWLGHTNRDELIGAYRAAAALWFPSSARSEAFGLVQIEAMANACPVINTDIEHSGVTWVSPNEQTGLTVRVNDAKALAAAAARLVAEPELRERFAREAQRRARREFGDAIMARRSLAAYRRILADADADVLAGGRARLARAGSGNRPVVRNFLMRVLHLYAGNLYGGIESALATLRAGVTRARRCIRTLACASRGGSHASCANVARR